MLSFFIFRAIQAINSDLLKTGLHLSVVQGSNKFVHSHVWTGLDFWSPRRTWKEIKWKERQQSHFNFRNSRGGSYLSEDILIDTLLKEKYKTHPGDLSWAGEEKIFSQYTLHFLLLSFQLLLFAWGVKTNCESNVWGMEKEKPSWIEKSQSGEMI